MAETKVSLRDGLAGRVAILSRHREPDDPELIAARDALRRDRWQRRLDDLLADLDELPPLSAEERVSIAAAVSSAVLQPGAA